MRYAAAVIGTIAAWFLGLLMDANLDFGDPQGFLCLRILLPIIVMGACILKAVREKEER